MKYLSIAHLQNLIEEASPSALLFLVDEHVKQYHAEYLINITTEIPSYIFVLKATESHKSLSVATHIWEYMLENQLDKKTLLLNLGGGIISDLGGFVAANYKRGVRFVNIPTTLLAMIDATIGGKNGINLNHIKNSIGTFHFPEKIIRETAFLQTLPPLEWKNGLGELLKYALLGNAEMWEELKKVKHLNGEDLKKEWIDFAIDFKEKIVKQDPFERDQRYLLNFGHTIGHALETLQLAKNEPIAHGHAVALGFIGETYISYIKGFINIAIVQDIQETVFHFFTKPQFTATETDQLLTYLCNDKKREKKNILIPLLKEIGNVNSMTEVSENEWKEALQYFLVQ